MRELVMVFVAIIGVLGLMYVLKQAPVNAYLVDEKNGLVPAACYVYNVETHAWDRLKQTQP